MGDRAEGAAVVYVPDEETVCRIGFSADHGVFRDNRYPETHDPSDGLLRLSEINLEDLKFRGFSVQMKSLYSENDAHQEARRRDDLFVARRGVSVGYRVAGVHMSLAGAISSVLDKDGDRAFDVLDTRDDEHPAHAEIRFAKKFPGAECLRLRSELRRVLGTLQNITLLDA